PPATTRPRWPAAGRSAASKSRAGSRPRQAATSEASGRPALCPTSSGRLWATISSQTPTRLISAAQPALSLRGDVDARHLLHHVLAQRARRGKVPDDTAARDQRLEERLGPSPFGVDGRGRLSGTDHVLQRAREAPDLL